jgi:alginate O-acetyltransferase complex protein AlgI
MNFTSWQFGVFVFIVFGAYYLPQLRTLQIQLLVVASLFFYGFGQPELLPLLAVAVFGTHLFFDFEFAESRDLAANRHCLQSRTVGVLQV